MALLMFSNIKCEKVIWVISYVIIWVLKLEQGLLTGPCAALKILFKVMGLIFLVVVIFPCICVCGGVCCDIFLCFVCFCFLPLSLVVAEGFLDVIN